MGPSDEVNAFNGASSMPLCDALGYTTQREKRFGKEEMEEILRNGESKSQGWENRNDY